MTSLLIVLLLIAANGAFAMSEIAVVSANRLRLQQWADEGSAAAQRALELAENPNRFLSTVQIGITLVGVVAGAFGGATLAGPLAERIAHIGPLARYSEALAFGGVVVLITYLSLVVGELTPKRIGLNDPERIAMAVAGPMHTLSIVATPVVSFLSGSTEAMLWLLRVRPRGAPVVSEEEIAVLVEQGRRAGVVEPAEQRIIERAFWIGEQRVTAIMTPRPDVAWIDLDDGVDALARTMAERPFSRYPVGRSPDDLVGVVHTRDLLARQIAGEGLTLEAVAVPPLFVPETLPIFGLLERFREHNTHFAIVVDEYGGLEGIVTMSDIVGELLGEVANQEPSPGPPLVRREDGSLLADGLIDAGELERELQLPADLPLEGEGYRTLGGFVTSRLGRVPKTGDGFRFGDYRFEVVAMDGRRVVRVLIAPRRAEAGSADAEPGRGENSERP